MTIQCDICGGALSVDAGGKTATCADCGMTYPIEYIQAKIKQSRKKQDDLPINKTDNATEKTEKIVQREAVHSAKQENVKRQKTEEEPQYTQQYLPKHVHEDPALKTLKSFVNFWFVVMLLYIFVAFNMLHESWILILMVSGFGIVLWKICSVFINTEDSVVQEQAKGISANPKALQYFRAFLRLVSVIMLAFMIWSLTTI
ncbi:MAG: hypothetical protein IJ411_04035 [Oscillospiraceae bacterium]|nr:hypothetical protein [Oscillospiraceae bacterium]